MSNTWRTGVHYVCHDCGVVTAANDLLTAPNPFALDDSDIIYGCPSCREAGTLNRACDREGCDRETSCGTPTPDGYRVTCGRHRPDEQRGDQ